jgi:hypothetical protein
MRSLAEVVVVPAVCSVHRAMVLPLDRLVQQNANCHTYGSRPISVARGPAASMAR